MISIRGDAILGESPRDEQEVEARRMEMSYSSSKMKEECPRQRDQNMQKLRGEEVCQEQKCDQCRRRGDNFRR